MAEKADFSRVIKKLGVIAADYQKEISAALFVGGLKIEEEAKASIQQGGKSGRTYKRRSVTHIASAPGEAPASDTGRLVNSFQTRKTNQGVDVAAGTGVVDYARDLEYGTKKMAERPFMRPALAKSRKFIEDRVIKGIKKASKKNGS